MKNMANKKWFYLIGSILILITLYLTDYNKKSTIITDNIFDINDISVVSKIFLSDREGNTITLEKDSTEWRVNKTFKVRKDAISTLLSTIQKIRIKKPVSNKAVENVIKYMATTGISVEIFSNNRIIKSYIIGSNTPNHLGTYMLLKDAKKPYVIHIPGFNGFLGPRYGVQGNTVNINEWRSTSVFNLDLHDIKYIKYTDLKNNTNSYVLTTSPFTLKNYNNKEVPFNEKKMFKLLNSFQNLNCESFKDNKQIISSKIQLNELIINNDTLRTYRMYNSDTINKKENFNVQRMFATINNGEIMLIQNYVFNKVLININEITD